MLKVVVLALVVVLASVDVLAVDVLQKLLLILINKTRLNYTLSKSVQINVLERFYLVLKVVVVELASMVFAASVVVLGSVVLDSVVLGLLKAVVF